MSSDHISEEDRAKISRFKGQVHAFDLVLGLEDFLLERVEARNEDVQSAGSKSDY